jgi:hypothetical protein
MMLDTEDKREVFRRHIADFGAWSDAEVAAWSDVELNALFIQFVSGDMREGDLSPDMTAEDWHAYQIRVEAGHIGGNIFGGPLCTGDIGEVYYSLSY